MADPLLVLACWIAPALFVAAVSQQSTLPTDTLFGRWMHATGWAGSLVVLGFAGTWALPLLTSVVAGDVFASEDRLGTWRHLLVAVRSPRRIFVAKALASLTVILLLVAGLACSSAVGGLVAVGNQPLVGLDGHLLSPSDAAGKVLLAWVCVLAPTLALAAIGLLGSVTLGRSPMGLLLPALVALAMQLAQMLPLPVAVRLALPGYAFIAWNGLFTSPAQLGPLLIGIAVSLVWAVTATALAYLLFLRRDFTNLTYDGSGRRAVTAGRPAAGRTARRRRSRSSPWRPRPRAPGSSRPRCSARSPRHSRTSTACRPSSSTAPTSPRRSCGSRRRATRATARTPPKGPGNDWRCVVSWHLPDVEVAGTAIYQLDVTSDGRFVADGDGPKEVNGYFLVRTPTGDAPNPLWQFDGNVELLSTTPKG